MDVLGKGKAGHSPPWIKIRHVSGSEPGTRFSVFLSLFVPLSSSSKSSHTGRHTCRMVRRGGARIELPESSGEALSCPGRRKMGVQVSVTVPAPINDAFYGMPSSVCTLSGLWQLHWCQLRDRVQYLQYGAGLVLGDLLVCHSQCAPGFAGAV